MTIVAFDCETHLIRPGLLAPPLVCVSFSDGANYAWLRDKEDGADEFETCLDAGDTLVGHNVAYDLGVLCAYRPSLIPKVFAALAAGRIKDTKVREELLDIAIGRKKIKSREMIFRDGAWVVPDYSLAALIKRYAGKDRFDDKSNPDSWRYRYAELDGVPVDQYPPAAYDYAIEDAADTLTVYRAQGGDITDEDPQVRAAWALHLMSCWGIRTDGEAVTALEAALKAEVKENFALLLRAGYYKEGPLTSDDRKKGKDYDFVIPGKKPGAPPRPMKWVKDGDVLAARVEAAYAALGKEVPKTATGRVATDKDTLNESSDDELSMLSESGGVYKLLTTYVPVLKTGATVPINARFNVLRNTGRTSCSNPNLQNLPTGRRVGGVRECFIPRPGYYFVSVDYDTLELRALAQCNLNLFGQSKMAEVIRTGKDLHSYMAANMQGVTYDDFMVRLKAKDPVAKNARDCAKASNFGLPGGLGAATLIEYARTNYKVVITLEKAWELKNQFLTDWPEMNLYFKFISDRVGFGEASFTQFVSGRVRGGCGYCDGANGLFQGLAACGAKCALCAVTRECYVDSGTALYGSRPVAFIHDEILAEVPIHNAHAASMRLAEVMCIEMARYIPDVPITASPALMARWYKGATAVYAPDNTLIPWVPMSTD